MITKIKYNNHDVLGNLCLDFRKQDGTPYKTIVFAGENGCGKTSVLKTISNFLNFGSFLPFEYIEYLQNGKLMRASIVHNGTGMQLLNEHFSRGYHYLVDTASGTSQTIISTKEKVVVDDIRYNGCFFSKARSGFKTGRIEFVKTGQLDTNKYDNDSSDDFTSTKQLLVDIESQDSSEWVNYSMAHPGSNINIYSPNFRLFRFKSAFNNFFEDIQFSKIETKNNSKTIIFTKFGKEIDIDQLSTGEQQIVFRGTQLLKNVKSINGGVVLIDEPELSMHPKWQRKVLDYYRNLFTNNTGQTAQLFFATHSEEVINNALKDPNTLVIVLKNKNGYIESRKVDAPIILPSLTSAEINFLAFNIISTDFHIALFSVVQNNNSLTSIQAVDRFIANNSFYDPLQHEKQYSFVDSSGGTRTFSTLPVYIRNTIDHPDALHSFTETELKKSVELLIKLLNPLLSI